MYYAHFGLTQPPFRITPDTSLFFPGANRGAVLEALIYAIVSGEGIVKVVGEVGSGKTMLCRMLEKELPEQVEIVYLANPRLPADTVLHAIAFELKLPVQEDTPRLQVLNKLQEYLVERHAQNHQVVVFVEEAQGMPIETLEEIRLLSNLETRQHKLLQIVLFGQPELDQRISRPEIRQLRERITYSFNLTPFHTNDIREYLNSRLRACGYRRGELFAEGAVKKIDQYSKGLVRRINILADKALLAAYANNRSAVLARDVERAASDSEFMSNRARLPWMAGAAAAALVIGGLGGWWWQSRTPAQDPVPVASATTAPAPEQPDQARPMQEPPASLQADAAAEDTTAEPLPAPQAPADTVPAAAGTAAPESATAAPEAATEAAPAAEPPITNVSAAGSVPVVAGPADQPPASQPAAQSEKLDILGVSAIFEMQDDDRPLTAEEKRQMQHMLAAVPPEGLPMEPSSLAGDVCSVCWSIVYRPLHSGENL